MNAPKKIYIPHKLLATHGKLFKSLSNPLVWMSLRRPDILYLCSRRMKIKCYLSFVSYGYITWSVSQTGRLAGPKRKSPTTCKAEIDPSSFVRTLQKDGSTHWNDYLLATLGLSRCAIGRHD